MQKIIIDTDPGIDDAQAIAFAVAHPDIELLGLTTVFGNASIDVTTKNALFILEQFGLPLLPVAKGAAKPLRQKPYPAPDFVHGEDGLGNLELPPAMASQIEETAAEFIVRSSVEQPGEISLVAIGPLTNIAQAVALDPQLPSRVKQLVIMGGSLDHPGNVTPLAEANFFNDPHAADEVLAHDWPVTVIGLDVTMQTLLYEQDLAEIRDQSGAVGQFLWDSGQFYLDFYASTLSPEDPSKRRCAMHDASALVYLVAPDLFKLVSGPARVINEGMASGQLSVDQRKIPYMLDHWSARPDCSVALDVASQDVINLFKNTITSHVFR